MTSNLAIPKIGDRVYVATPGLINSWRWRNGIMPSPEEVQRTVAEFGQLESSEFYWIGTVEDGTGKRYCSGWFFTYEEALKQAKKIIAYCRKTEHEEIEEGLARCERLDEIERTLGSFNFGGE